eukprot:403372110
MCKECCDLVIDVRKQIKCPTCKNYTQVGENIDTLPINHKLLNEIFLYQSQIGQQKQAINSRQGNSHQLYKSHSPRGRYQNNLESFNSVKNYVAQNQKQLQASPSISQDQQPVINLQNHKSDTRSDSRPSLLQDVPCISQNSNQNQASLMIKFDSQCNIHQAPYQAFCETDLQLLCIECIISPEHKPHNVLKIDQAYEKLVKLHLEKQNKLNLEIQELGINSVDEVFAQLQKRKDQMEQVASEVISKYIKFTDYLHQKINKRKEEMIDIINNKLKKEINIIENYEGDIKNTLSMINFDKVELSASTQEEKLKFLEDQKVFKDSRLSQEESLKSKIDQISSIGSTSIIESQFKMGEELHFFINCFKKRLRIIQQQNQNQYSHEMSKTNASSTNNFIPISSALYGQKSKENSEKKGSAKRLKSQTSINLDKVQSPGSPLTRAQDTNEDSVLQNTINTNHTNSVQTLLSHQGLTANSFSMNHNRSLQSSKQNIKEKSKEAQKYQSTKSQQKLFQNFTQSFLKQQTPQNLHNQSQIESQRMIAGQKNKPQRLYQTFKNDSDKFRNTYSQSSKNTPANYRMQVIENQTSFNQSLDTHNNTFLPSKPKQSEKQLLDLSLNQILSNTLKPQTQDPSQILVSQSSMQISQSISNSQYYETSRKFNNTALGPQSQNQLQLRTPRVKDSSSIITKAYQGIAQAKKLLARRQVRSSDRQQQLMSSDLLINQGGVSDSLAFVDVNLVKVQGQNSFKNTKDQSHVHRQLNDIIKELKITEKYNSSSNSSASQHNQNLAETNSQRVSSKNTKANVLPLQEENQFQVKRKMTHKPNQNQYQSPIRGNDELSHSYSQSFVIQFEDSVPNTALRPPKQTIDLQSSDVKQTQIQISTEKSNSKSQYYGSTFDYKMTSINRSNTHNHYNQGAIAANRNLSGIVEYQSAEKIKESHHLLSVGSNDKNGKLSNQKSNSTRKKWDIPSANSKKLYLGDDCDDNEMNTDEFADIIRNIDGCYTSTGGQAGGNLTETDLRIIRKKSGGYDVSEGIVNLRQITQTPQLMKPSSHANTQLH